MSKETADQKLRREMSELGISELLASSEPSDQAQGRLLEKLYDVVDQWIEDERIVHKTSPGNCTLAAIEAAAALVAGTAGMGDLRKSNIFKIHNAACRGFSQSLFQLLLSHLTYQVKEYGNG